ncbi:hypothetical protein CY35_01G002600 [Sphagnum magellanicum]|nr:hypothetical protein CY35_01G002600 [Sphagnum magellanicum]
MRRNGVKVLGISLHTSRGGSLTPLCSGHTCCYFSPLISFGIFKEVPQLGSESCITKMGMPQPEKGHVFGNKLPLNALPNLQHLLDLQVLTCTLLRP